jgi:hypothetical protein
MTQIKYWKAKQVCFLWCIGLSVLQRMIVVYERSFLRNYCGQILPLEIHTALYKAQTELISFPE